MVMDRRTYITKDELNKVLKYLKDNELYRHYVITLCLCELTIKFKDLETLTWDRLYLILADRTELITEFKSLRELMLVTYKSTSGHDRSKVVQMTLRGYNRSMKEHQRYMGLRHIAEFSTKLFNTKMTMDSGEAYGYIEYRRSKNIDLDRKDNYIYVLKHTHRDEMISNQLTDKKIGITNNPRNRKMSLTLGPVGIECIKLWKVDVSFVGRIEKLLHTKFTYRKIIGEWFTDKDDDLIELIENEFETFKLLGISVEEVPSNLMSHNVIE